MSPAVIPPIALSFVPGMERTCRSTLRAKSKQTSIGAEIAVLNATSRTSYFAGYVFVYLFRRFITVNAPEGSAVTFR